MTRKRSSDNRNSSSWLPAMTIGARLSWLPIKVIRHRASERNFARGYENRYRSS